MPVLSQQTVILNDGDLKLYKRARSRSWQATFNIDGHWVRISTKCRDLEEAKVAAKAQMVEYQFRQKHQLPVVSKKFGDVARLAIAEMRTGIREGTEADNLLWQHVHLFEDKGKQYLEMSVNGKTGRRDIICRANTLIFLKRIHERCGDISKMTFEQLLKAKVNKPVFRLSDGSVTKNLRQTFKAFLTDIGLLVCPRTGQSRTLYSLRHTYATFALVRDGMEIHTLATQMGTSIQMIERHYALERSCEMTDRHYLPNRILMVARFWRR